MDERILKYLLDIENSINEIEGYFKEISKNFNVYRQNVMLKRAVERNLEIIGEAVNFLSVDLKKQNSDINWRAIVALRNILIHEYFAVDENVMWIIIQKDLPLLKKKIEELLNNK